MMALDYGSKTEQGRHKTENTKQTQNNTPYRQSCSNPEQNISGLNRIKQKGSYVMTQTWFFLECKVCLTFENHATIHHLKNTLKENCVHHHRCTTGI